MYWYFACWVDDGTLDRAHDMLGIRVRRADGRDGPPTAGVVDSQSVPGADTVGSASRGYDAGKKINGRKRHIVVDTLGLLLVVLVTAASVQDRDGGRRVMLICRQAHPTVRLVWADGGYAGQLVSWAKTMLDLVVSIVAKPAGQRGFAVLPRRWVVERTFAWLTKCRRIDRDYERLPEHFRSDDQVGDGRGDDPSTGTNTRPPALGHSPPMTTFQTRIKSVSYVDGR